MPFIRFSFFLPLALTPQNNYGTHRDGSFLLFFCFCFLATYSKKFKALHETDIILHQAAKKYFDELGYDKEKKLPTVASFRAEYATMLDEKKKAYREYRQTKSEMQSLLTARTNVQRLLNITERSEREHKKPTL